MRLAVAAQEILQAQYITVARRADDNGAGLALFKEADPAQDQRPHQALAQIGFLHQEVAQGARRHHDRLDIRQGRRVHQRRTFGKLRQLAQEIARAMFDNGRVVGEFTALDHAHFPRKQEQQSRGYFPGLHDARASRIVPDLAEPLQAREILLLQLGEHLVAARIHGGGFGHGAGQRAKCRTAKSSGRTRISAATGPRKRC